jgi:anti-sigma factor RsiW
VPTDRYPQDERLERLEDYLLGRLSDAEAEQFDELSIADEEFAWQLRAAENDLVDAYVRDNLPAETRARFESFYLASPRRRERVELARSLAKAADRVVDRPVAVNAPNPSHETDPPAARTNAAWWLLATAAAVVVALGGILFRAVLRPPETAAPAATSSRATPARESGAPAPSATPPPKSLSTSIAPVVVTPSPPSSSVATTEPILLAPDTRGGAGSVATVTVPIGADRVAFDLRLETNDFSRYRATLKDPGSDRAVWQSGWIAPAVKRESPVVPIAVPARTLKTQHYAFELTGRTDTNRTDLVASYVFEVVPR